MLRVTNKQVARSLLHFKTSPEMAPLKAYLTELLNEEAMRLIKLTDAQLIGRVQGRAELLDELLDTVEVADGLLDKLER